MAASINDKITNVSNGTRPVSTTVASTRTSGATSLSCTDLTGWATDTAVHFVTYKVDGQGAIVAGSQADWKGIVSGSTINNLTLTGGTDNGNASGDIVQILPTARWAKEMTDALRATLDQTDGSILANKVDTTQIKNSAVTTAKLANGAVTTDTLADSAVTNSKLSTTAGELGGAWTSFTATLSGWSGTPSQACRYMRIGKTVFMYYQVSGTSNSTSASMTVPIPSANISVDGWGSPLDLTVDSGSTQTTPGKAFIGANSSTLGFYKSMSGSGWTASGAKNVRGVLIYEAQ